MLVVKIFRYVISILSIIIAILGIAFFVMYYNSKEFYSNYQDIDSWVIGISVIASFCTEIVNMVYLIVKECYQPKRKFRIKHSVSDVLLLLLIAIICFFVLGANALYMQISFLLSDIMFLVIGDAIDYSEVVDVDTTYE